MAYALSFTATVKWIPDGAGPMSVPSAQVLQVTPSSNGTVTFSGMVPIQGADTLTSANLTSAGTSAGVQIGSAAFAYITQLQGWSTGGN